MRVKRRFGQWLVRVGMKLAGDKPADISITDIKTVLDQPHDAVVDQTEAPVQWAPEQHGGVVIAEPDMITLHRRGKL
jgi:hypothetical protein